MMALSTTANIGVCVNVDIWDVYDALSDTAKDAFIEELMAGATDSVDGIAQLLDRAGLDLIKGYVQTRFRPCDIFDRGDLEAWANYYGYEKVKR